MSIQAVAWALEQDVPKSYCKLVLVSLANAHNQSQGKCFPSIGRLAKEASCSEASVRRALAWLEKNGLVKKIESFAPSGRQQPNDYILCGEGVTLTPRPVTCDGGEGVTQQSSRAYLSDTPSKEESKGRARAGASELIKLAPGTHDAQIAAWESHYEEKNQGFRLKTMRRQVSRDGHCYVELEWPPGHYAESSKEPADAV